MDKTVRNTAPLTRLAAAALALCVSLAAAPAGASPSGTAAASGPTRNYRFVTLTKVPGAVDIVERSPRDGFVYVVSRRGTIERVSLTGKRLGRVLDIRRLTTDDGERGLLGLAFRRYSGKWEAFVNYTDTEGDTVVARWAVSAGGTFVRQPAGTVSRIITIDQPYANHNGGAVKTGPDNMLYIGMGDGGSGGDPERRALDTSSLLGKILRIDPLHTARGTGRAYRIPTDNPFIGRGRGEIWSIGLRNPWRFSFDGAGNMWVADVGQNKWEEASVAKSSGGAPGGRGTNFGWSAWEARDRFNQDQAADGTLFPFLQYDHSDGRCSISGGAVATTRSLPRRAGWYFHGDFCGGDITAVKTDGKSVLRSETVGRDVGNITAVTATSGALWFVTLDGEVKKIVQR